ncbi:MAG TPA: ATP-binding protein [Devosia sp.]|nr:ATP-binding protein [Devosia sp.]
MTEAKPDYEIIREVPIFAGLTQDEARQLCNNSKRLEVGAGTLIIAEGAVGDALYILLSGELEVTKHDGDREIVLAVRGPGEVLGEMSILEQTPRTASVRTTKPSELLEIGAETLQQLMKTDPAIATSLLRTIARRLRSTESLLVQSDKLASLGTLAAGLAHELNNPAAAIQRSVALLAQTMAEWNRHAMALGTTDTGDAERRILAELEQELSRPGGERPADLESQQQESQLADWLEDRSIPAPWDLAPALVAHGWTAERMARLAGSLPAGIAVPAIQWLGTGFAVYDLVAEIRMSSGAITGIVNAVKSYSYLDRAPVQNVDIRRSLEDTLTILAHKLKHGVEIVRAVDPALPQVEAYAGELNQVWTNIIDNAAQAMDGKGRLELSARQLGDEVEVRIIDSGPGIPEEVLPRIFEPFFTTKAQGVGTGLGLHIAHNIIVARHGGRLDVESRPGRTEFRIVLPLQLRASGTPAAAG